MIDVNMYCLYKDLIIYNELKQRLHFALFLNSLCILLEILELNKIYYEN